MPSPVPTFAARWVASCLAALGCLACAPAEEAAAPRPARPLVVAVAGDFSGPNELLSSSQLDHEIRSNVFVHLLEEQPDYQDHPPTLAPQLATRWEFSPDRLTLTFFLRPDARWSDGEPITAEDVRWSWQAQTSPEVGWIYGYVKEAIHDVEVVDATTVRFHFTRAYPNQLLDANEGHILPRHAWSQLPFAEWQDQATWFQDHLVAAGPYTIRSWKPQQEVVLAANPASFGYDPAQIDSVVLRVVPDENARLRQLLTGEADLLRRVPAARAAEAEATPGVSLREIDSRQYNFIAWNLQRPPFHSTRVRQALTLAIDRDALVETLYFGRALVGDSPYPSSVWVHDPELEPWPYDPERARQLLAEEGWRDSDGDGIVDRAGEPFRFELTTNTGNQLRRDALVLIQEQLRQVGIDAEPVFLEIQALITSNESGDFDATLGAWAIDTTLDVRYAFHSDEAAEGANYGGFANPEADGLMDEIANLSDPAELLPRFHRLQEILHEEQPYTFLWEPRGLVGLRDRVTQAHPNALRVLFDLETWRLAS